MNELWRRRDEYLSKKFKIVHSPAISKNALCLTKKQQRNIFEKENS